MSQHTADAASVRAAEPPMPGGELVLNAPPSLPTGGGPGVVARVVPIVMVLAMAGMMALMFTASGGIGRNPMMLMFPVMMLVSMVGMLASGARGNQGSADVARERADYLRYLGRMRRRATDAAAAQRLSLEYAHPDPDAVWRLCGTARQGERHVVDDDFGHVRIGRGEQRLATTLTVPELAPLEQLDPVSAISLRRLVRAHAVVPDLPIAMAIGSVERVLVEGDVQRSRAFVRAILVQLSLFHHPSEVTIGVAADAEAAPGWEWTKWLPHRRRGLGAGLHLLVVDGAEPPEPVSRPGTTTLVIDRSGTVGSAGSHPDDAEMLVLRIEGDTLAVRVHEHTERFGRADTLDLTAARQFAMRLARSTPRSAAAASAPRARSWAGLLGITDVHALDVEAAWVPRVGAERLAVPIGFHEDGSPLILDLKEAAEHGVGPHGLCIGATGSGKSELLRTLVLSLVATHSPEQVNLVLIDFKGGASFLGFEALPHVSAVITNLEQEAVLVERMRDALGGELARRQQVLRAAGGYAGVAEYEAARIGGEPLEPLPALLVVIDEFSELLAEHPDFAELFVAIGRLGRSLHVHLLLASQRLEEGRMRGLDSHLSYRIGLKTFSAGESRAVLGIPDAYALPPQPGAGYLRTDSTEPIRWDAAYVSGPAPAAVGAAGAPRSERPTRFTAAESAPADPPPVDAPPGAEARSVAEVVVAQLIGRGTPAHRVWLPPLAASPSLGSAELAGPGRTGAEPDGVGAAGLRVAVGIVDLPFEQRRDPLFVDLRGGAGHIGVVGGPRSGKSSALATIVAALASQAGPREMQCYVLDFGGGAAGALRALPQVGSVATRREPDLVRGMVAHLLELLDGREAGESAESPAVPASEVFLVIDGFEVIRQEFEELEAQITDLARRGLSFGLHVVLSASRWLNLRPALKDAIGTRLELRLGDPTESEVGRRLALSVPADRPGRGLTADGHHMLLARTDAAGLDAIARRSAGQPAAPPIRLLPEAVALSALPPLPEPASSPDFRVRIGPDGAGNACATIDFAAEPHLLVVGEGAAGKTAALRLILGELLARTTASDLKVLVADYRRTMLGFVPAERLAAYAGTAEQLARNIVDLAALLTSRLPGDDVTPDELRARAWWSGPEVVLVVDDYELVAAPSGNPLAPLVPLLPHARDVGLHVVVARRAAGFARAAYEPVLGGLRDLGAPTLILSGSPDEGPIVAGVKARPAPPGRAQFVTRAAVVAVQIAQLGTTAPVTASKQ